MDFLANFVDFFLHLDHHLHAVIEQYGAWTYLILFLIIFCETGLVFTPILPGDSLLFVAGAVAGVGELHIGLLLGLLTAAAILGNTANYWMGFHLAPRLMRFIKPEHLNRTQKFYDKHGAKTIIITRFLPIIRTIAPFLAGIGKMRYGRFLTYNVAGGVLWVSLFTLAGYFFGELPVVKRNFTLVVFLIIVLSLIPAVVEFIKHRKGARR